jgi:superfamily II DNA or RNA helicase
MADISLKKIDEVYLKVTCDPSIGYELNQHFSFDVPGAKFSPLFKNKMWDGKIHLYHLMTGTIYVGLKNYIEHFAEVNNYTVEVDEHDFNLEDVTLEEVKEFCNGLNLALPSGQSIRDYQLEAIYQAIINSRRMLLSPTGSGKSLIIYCLLRWHERYKRKQLILVPTTSLVEQLYSDFNDYSKNNGWQVSENCSKVYSGHDKNSPLPVTISTWQSIYTLPKQYFSKIDVIYGDEAHLFKAKSLTSIMHKCVNTPFRVGTTGTLDGTKTHRLVLEGIFGPVLKVTTTRELMDKDQLAELKIFGIVLNYTDDIKKQCKGLTYQDEMDFLVQYDPRNKFIRNLALKQEGNSLVLFQYVEKHGRALHAMIHDKDSERKVFFVYGGTDTEQRENIRRITEGETDAIIVASYGTFSTGINIKNLHNIIFASPTKSRIRNLQSIGRGLRRNDTKVVCNLYDIGDDLTWKSKKNYTLQHMVERIKIYNEEDFSYKLIKVDI